MQLAKEQGPCCTEKNIELASIRGVGHRLITMDMAETSADNEQNHSRLMRLIEDFPELFGASTGLVLRHMDFAAIVKLSRTCKVYQYLGVDQQVWRMLCIFSWGSCRQELDLYGGCWRNMFIHRARPRTDGVYVIK